MGRTVTFFGKIVAATLGSIALAAACHAQVAQPYSPPDWLMFSSAPLNSQPTTFAPAAKEAQPAGAAAGTERGNASGEKDLDLAALRGDGAAAARSGRTATRSGSPSHEFDGGLHLGEPSLRFETETKIQNTPLRDEMDTGFADANPRSNLRIPFIGLSIVSPLN